MEWHQIALMQQTIGNARVASILQRARPSVGRSLLQRFGVTIELDNKDRVKTLEAHGRPKGSWQPKKGAHVTAFGVFVEGLRNNLAGDDLEEALADLRWLTHAIERLPGYDSASGLGAVLQLQNLHGMTQRLLKDLVVRLGSFDR
jgi:hypothetical protein